MRVPRYVAGSVRDLAAPPSGLDLVTWTLPFLFEAPLAAWGLPDRFFEPRALLAHVLGLLFPRGTRVIVNQGDRSSFSNSRRFTCTPRVGTDTRYAGRHHRNQRQSVGSSR